MDIIEHCALYCNALNPKTQKHHDKLYYLVLIRNARAYEVRTMYGERGSTLRPGVGLGLTFSNEADARRFYAQILTEKTSFKKKYVAVPWPQFFPPVGFGSDIDRAILNLQFAQGRGASRAGVASSRPQAARGGVAPWASALFAAIPADGRDYAIGVLRKRVDDATAIMLEQAKETPTAQIGQDWARAVFSRIPPSERHGVWRSLSKVFHPDRGGDVHDMEKWNDAYARFSSS